MTPQSSMTLWSVTSKNRFWERTYLVGDVTTCECHDRNIQRDGAHHIFWCVSVLWPMSSRQRPLRFPHPLNSWGYFRPLRVFRQSVSILFLHKDFNVHLNPFWRMTLKSPWWVWLLYHKSRRHLKPQTVPHICARADTWTHHQTFARNVFDAAGLLHSRNANKMDDISITWRIYLVGKMSGIMFVTHQKKLSYRHVHVHV